MAELEHGPCGTGTPAGVFIQAHSQEWLCYVRANHSTKAVVSDEWLVYGGLNIEGENEI